MKPASNISYKNYGGNAPVNYEQYFVPVIGKPFATNLLAAAALRKGERVLDVACGTGIVSRLAAEAVGSGGVVIGLDVNPGMLSIARSVTSQGASIEWHEASAEAIPLPSESFDVVLCSLGLQFIPDKLAALREMHRVLVRGGRLAINAVGPTPPVFAILEEALSKHVKPEVGAFVQAVFSFHDAEEVRDLINRSGFSNVSVKTEKIRVVLPPPKDFLWQYVYSTPLAAALDHVDETHRFALEREVVAGWETFLEDGAFVGEPSVTVATAIKH